MSNQKTAKEIELNFSELATGSTTLNFGSESSVNHGYVVSQITSINITSQAQYKPPKSNTGQITANVVSFSANIHALFDLNFIRSLEHSLKDKYQIAKHTEHLHHTEYEQSKSASLNNTIGFYFAKELNNGLSCQFESTKVLSTSFNSRFEKALNLNNGLLLLYQDNFRLKKSKDIGWQEATQKYELSQIDWIELDHKRNLLSFSHEVAEHIEHSFSFTFSDGLEVLSTNDVTWQEARAVYYRKHEIAPIQPKPKTTFVGSTDFDFQCECTANAHHLNFNFGVSECMPSIKNQKGWYIVNEIKVTRIDTNEEIKVLNGSFSTDRSSWCWGYSLTIPHQEIQKTQSNDGNPVILNIQINNENHRMLVENRSLSRQFASAVYTVTGRSTSALLDSPASPTRIFLQENERTSVQLAQAELDRVNSATTLNWHLVDELGWVLPENSFSYSNLTPISAIKQLAEAGGGFIYSEPSNDTLSIKPLCKRTFWESLESTDYDRLIPESLVISESIDDVHYPDYNGVFLTNDRLGKTAQIKRTGTNGDTLQETINNPLYTTSSVFSSAAKAMLAKAGLVETHTLQMPFSEKVGLCKPAELVAFNGEWWGIVDSVSVAFSYDKVIQTVAIERVNHNE